jgi:hypothetical protein
MVRYINVGNVKKKDREEYLKCEYFGKVFTMPNNMTTWKKYTSDNVGHYQKSNYNYLAKKLNYLQFLSFETRGKEKKGRTEECGSGLKNIKTICIMK